MADIKNQTLQGRQVIDGKSFIDCEFQNAQMVYKGGPAPNFTNCRFTKSGFVFENEAANTMNLLRAMLQPQTNMRPFVLGMMPEIGGN
ncbi:MAG: hypothetical protein KKA16_10580 [Alphaproteobacteria bacterium]|nr:hypothetical protein [Alphaproteobacteria bacterium]MBU2380532.1 hypothetical protein [Alphaproteobacteria bacterium]